MGEAAARAFLRETADRDVCIAYVEDQHGALVFVPEARIVPLARLASAATIAVLGPRSKLSRHQAPSWATRARREEGVYWAYSTDEQQSHRGSVRCLVAR
jgi:hypothetical protein